MPRNKRRHDLLQTRREDVGGIEGDPDKPTADDHRHRSKKERRQRGEKPRALDGSDCVGSRLTKRRDRFRRPSYSATATPTREAEEQQLPRWRSVGSGRAYPTRWCSGRATPGGSPQMTFFHSSMLRMLSLRLEQGARKPARRRVADLGPELLGLQQDGAGQTLGFVVFGNGRFPVPPGPSRSSALSSGSPSFGFGPSWVEPRLAGLETGSLFGDQTSRIRFDDRLDLKLQFLSRSASECAGRRRP